jgi:hypothetical protein
MEFMRFFWEGLNPFEIQTSFKVDLLLNFVIQNLEIFGSWTKRIIVLFESFYQHAKFGEF